MKIFSPSAEKFVQRHAVWICLVGVLAQTLAFHHPTILPQWSEGAHAWRQADALSQTQQFRLTPDRPLWRPAMHFIHPDAGRGEGAGEFTGSYWLNARLWSLLGADAPWPWTLRLTHWLVWLAGLMALFAWSRRLSGKPLFAILLTWLVQASPVAAFYAPSLLVNPMGLAFVFIAWWAAGNKRWVITAAAMALAMLFRPTMALGLVPLTMLAWRNGSARPAAASTTAALALALSWVFWARAYNEATGSVYFLTSTSPLSEVLANGRATEYFTLFRDVLLNEWYPAAVRWAAVVALAVLGVQAVRHRTARFWAIWAVATTAAVGGYIYMWFGRLNHHDYYLLDALVLLPVLVHALDQTLRTRPLLHALLACAVLWSSLASRDRSAVKWGLPSAPTRSAHVAPWEIGMWRDHHAVWRQRFAGMDSLSSRWAALGVGEEAVLVCLPDASPNIALTRLGRNGFTSLYDNDLKGAERVAHFAALGATHFVVLDPGILKEGEWNDVSMTPVDAVGAVWLFSLQHED